MMKSLLTGATLALGMATAAVADGHETTKVGFVYVGPIGDGGWTYEHNQSRLAVEDHFGDAVETVYVESVPEGPDAERVMTQMALDGVDLIFTTSFGYMDPTINVAAKFPDVRFEHATGYKRAENVSTYSARFYEGRAVQGHIAGSLTESNIVGYIGSVPIPEVIRGINSAYLHAKAVNPDVEFKIVWIYEWLNPAKEADAATTLIEQGADIILQHTDSTAPLAAAEAAGVLGFGQASDMADFTDTSRIGSIIDNWAPYYIDRVQAVIDGTWESVDTWDGMSTGMVEMGQMTDKIPAGLQAEANALTASISNGDYHPFTGPINKQDGSVWLADGEVASDYGDGGLAGMNFYVEGIVGDVPQ